MARNHSKNPTRNTTVSETPQEAEKTQKGFKSGLSSQFSKARAKTWDWAKNPKPLKLHRSFRRSYHEDYDRPLKTPGLLHFSLIVLKTLFKNFKLFGVLLILALALNMIFVGIMSEDTYSNFTETVRETTESIEGANYGEVGNAALVLASTIATGGFRTSMTEAHAISAGIIFFIIWLTTIYLYRQILADRKPKLRDGLYNALAPLLSTLFVAIYAFLCLVPILIVFVLWTTAIATDFLSTPFYSFIFFIPAALLVLLSCYLLPGALTALTAVTAPGLYPLVAVNTSNNLVAGRRIRYILRLLFILFMILIVWSLVMVPVILFDSWLKSSFPGAEGLPIVPIALQLMTSGTFVYLSAYLYAYYRVMLNDPR